MLDRRSRQGPLVITGTTPRRKDPKFTDDHDQVMLGDEHYERSIFTLRRDAPNIVVRTVPGFSGPARRVTLDGTTSSKVLPATGFIQLYSTGRLLLKEGRNRIVCEIPAHQLVEVISREPRRFTLEASIGTALGTALTMGQTVLAEGQVWANDAVQFVGSWVDLPEEAVDAITIRRISNLVGTGTFWIDGRNPNTGYDHAVVLTAALPLTLDTAGEGTIVTYLSDAHRTMPGQRRLRIDLDPVAPPNTVTFEDVFITWGRNLTNDINTDLLTTTMLLYTEPVEA